jgi:hypothetical protein
MDLSFHDCFSSGNQAQVAAPSFGVPNLQVVVHIAHCHVRFIVHYNFFPLSFSMNKAIPLSCHSPEFKGISALNIIYEAGKESLVNVYIALV